MIQIKDKFELLANTPNILSEGYINPFVIKRGYLFVRAILKIHESRISHFTKKKIFNFLETPEVKNIKVVNIPKYPLSVTSTKDGKLIVINLNAFGVDDINRITPNNVYSALVYGVCFSSLLSGKYRIGENRAAPIISYFLSLFMQLFGKQFGLLGLYSKEIIKLKFLTACYVLSSFFGVSGEKLYRQASMFSTYDYKDIKDELKRYNFESIEDFIKCTSDLKAMPGINRYTFTARIYKSLSMEFVPGLEDLSRFISVMTIAGLTGSTIVPTHLIRFNEVEYSKIVELAKPIFR